MRINKTFRYTRSDERDIAGWVPNWIKGFDATAGFGLAHDVLEHNHSRVASVENEFIALGAMLWGRGQGGYWQQKNYRSQKVEYSDNVPPDIVDILSRNGLCSPRPSRRFQLEDYVEQQLAATHTAVVRDWDYFKADSNVTWSPERIEELARNAMQWIRHGFRLADKRYETINCSHFCDIFWQIEKHELVAEPNSKDLEEGDTLHVEVLVERGLTRIWVNDHRDY